MFPWQIGLIWARRVLGKPGSPADTTSPLHPNEPEPKKQSFVNEKSLAEFHSGAAAAPASSQRGPLSDSEPESGPDLALFMKISIFQNLDSMTPTIGPFNLRLCKFIFRFDHAIRKPDAHKPGEKY